MITRELMLDILLEIDQDVAKEYALLDQSSTLELENLIERVDSVIESHEMTIMRHADVLDLTYNG